MILGNVLLTRLSAGNFLMLSLKHLARFIACGLLFSVCFQAGLACAGELAASVPEAQAISQPVSSGASADGAVLASVASSPVSEEAGVVAAYRVGPDDEIKIMVFGEPDLSGQYAVNGAGILSMPLIGDIPVKGLGLKEIESAVVARLKDGYILEPHVSVEIAKYRPFYILGEVRSPGSYPYVNNMSVLNAVALAGGFTYRANKKNVEIMRTAKELSKLEDDQPVEATVLPGDIILVKERFF
jgi:protein involved in polysaccharide export with SLBB domain